eukprot:gene2267-3500_t
MIRLGAVIYVSIAACACTEAEEADCAWDPSDADVDGCGTDEEAPPVEEPVLEHGSGQCPRHAVAPDDNGGWEPPEADRAMFGTDKCTIERVHASSLSRDQFLAGYWQKRPVIVVGGTENAGFKGLAAKESLLKLYGNLSVTLSSANKNSYAKRVVSLREYVAGFLDTPPVVQLGNTTWYHFGNNNHAEWPELFACYKLPTQYMQDPSYFAFSFGMGGSGSGVPFHTHGGVFNEVVYGRKRWWLAPPGPQPDMEPNESALQWLYTYYPRLNATESPAPVIECVIGEGEFLYVPGQWHHSTLNIGQTIFMATF